MFLNALKICQYSHTTLRPEGKFNLVPLTWWVCPPRTHLLKLNPQWGGIWRRSLLEVIRYEREALMNGISVLLRSNPKEMISLSHWWHSKKLSICNQKGGPHLELDWSDLDPGLPCLQNCEKWSSVLLAI